MKIYKKIRIWNLPTNKIYIKFNKEYREKFFSLVHQKFGNFNLAGEFLQIKRPDSLLAGNWRKGTNCCPLSLMLTLANEIGISFEDLEKNIEEIRYKTSLNKRGGSSGKSIINPKLPVLINEDFAEILGHLCGDGTISRSNPKKGMGFKYVNSEPTLINSFQILMKRIFGDIWPNIIIRNGSHYNRDNYVLEYPSIISAFILCVFDYKTDKEMELPSFIFNMSQKAKARFLRALFDDEACVEQNRKKINLGLKPIKPVQDIIKLLSEFGIKTGSIYKYTNRMYNKFEIADQNSIMLFSKIIGFKHPKKIKRLNNIIKTGWKFKRYYNNEAKDKIIKLLRIKGSLEVSQISKILKRHEGTIQEHLEDLRNEGKTVSYKIQRRVNNTNSFPNIWLIKK